jgi:O-antigen ligase
MALQTDRKAEKNSMRYLLLSGQSVVKSAAPGNKSSLGGFKVVIKTSTPNWIIRYAFYAFVVSLPFEAADIGTESTLPKFLGVALAALALLQPRLCYKFPPKAFWWFVAYVFGYALYGAYLILTLPRVPGFAGSIIFGLFKFIQLLLLFWISYNLMKYERIVKGALLLLATSTILLAILQFLGITSVVEGSRTTAFRANPNTLATILSLGLLVLVGLAFGREKRDWKAFLLFWLCSGIVAIAIVQTGSRGALVGLVGSLSIFFLTGKSLATKLKLGVIALVGIIGLAWASYQIDVVRARWEKSIYEGNLAGREEIFPAAVEMILEKPLLGWGPVYHTWELGGRRAELARDEHNLYLWLLAEVGIVGAIPFLVGLWLCWRTAWKARHSIQGVLPLIMLLFILIINLKGTTINLKLFWVVLSYALASSSYIAGRRVLQAAVSSRYIPSRVTQHGISFKPSKTSSRPARKVFGVPPS